MRKTIVVLLIVVFTASFRFSTFGGDEPVAVPPSPQRTGGTAAKGYDYLVNGDYIRSGIPYSIYLFGGESQAERKNLDSVLRLDLEKNIWETVTPMPTARKFARAVPFMGSIYIVGGSTVPANSHSPTGTDSVEKFTQPGCS